MVVVVEIVIKGLKSAAAHSGSRIPGSKQGDVNLSTRAFSIGVGGSVSLQATLSFGDGNAGLGSAQRWAE